MNKRSYNFKDLTGQKFGRLIVIKFVGTDHNQKSLWLCKCQCGKEKIFGGSNLRNGNSKSCGCLRIENLIKRQTKHSMALSTKRHPLYIVWKGMKARCLNPNEPSYPNYGGRGIAVCDEWLEFEPFAKWAFENGYDKSLEIDRIDNDKGYSPDNCRWATRSQNQLNKRNNHLITIKGKTKTLSEWSRESGISIHTICSRIRYGWNDDDLLKPIGQYDVSKRKREKLGKFVS